MPPEDRALVEENKQLVIQLLRRMMRMNSGEENAATDALFKQLGVLEWWLNAATGPMPEEQRKTIRGWCAEIALNLAVGFGESHVTKH